VRLAWPVLVLVLVLVLVVGWQVLCIPGLPGCVEPQLHCPLMQGLGWGWAAWVQLPGVQMAAAVLACHHHYHPPAAQDQGWAEMAACLCASPHAFASLEPYVLQWPLGCCQG
jgi:hypothetical protein